MWEIENHPDVLCIDKDETAEEFLCDAYGVVKPMKSPARVVPEDEVDKAVVSAPKDKVSIKEVETPQIQKAEIIQAKEAETPQVDKVEPSPLKPAGKKENLIEFSDSESEDMAPLYSKLIIIAGSRDIPNDKPDSSTANHEAEALITNNDTATTNNNNSNNIKACWVVVDKLTQGDINKATRVAPEYGPSTQLLSQECVTTINKEPRVIDTIIIDSDDNLSSVIMLTPPERVVLEPKSSETMPKSRQINIPRWPKPLFEKCVEGGLRSDKTVTPSAIKRPIVKPKDKHEKKEKQDSVKKTSVREVPLSFDNLFNKKFTILGSGLKIGKKVTAASVPAAAAAAAVTTVDVEEEGSIELVLEIDDDDEEEEDEEVAKKKRKKTEEGEEEEEGGKWCRAQNYGNDDDDDDVLIGGFVEPNVADDDDGDSNTSWTCREKKKREEEDVEFQDMVDMTRSRRSAKEAEEAEQCLGEDDDDDVDVITGEGGGEQEEEEEEEEWRRRESRDRGKWFEVDKYGAGNSPPRFCDLVEKKVIKPPEEEPVFTDRFYELWADSGPKHKQQPHHRPNSYASRFTSPYVGSVPLAAPPPPPPPLLPCVKREQRDPRVCHRDRGAEGRQEEGSLDIWKRLVASRTRGGAVSLEQRSRLPPQPPRGHCGVPQGYSSRRQCPPQQQQQYEQGAASRGFMYPPQQQQQQLYYGDGGPLYHHSNSPYIRHRHPQYSVQALYSDRELFYRCYPHMLHLPTDRGRLFTAHSRRHRPAATVELDSPESPDPEVTEDCSTYIKKEATAPSLCDTVGTLPPKAPPHGLRNPFYKYNAHETYTPASPDIASPSSPSPPSLHLPPPPSTIINNIENSNTVSLHNTEEQQHVVREHSPPLPPPSSTIINNIEEQLQQHVVREHSPPPPPPYAIINNIKDRNTVSLGNFEEQQHVVREHSPPLLPPSSIINNIEEQLQHVVKDHSPLLEATMDSYPSPEWISDPLKDSGDTGGTEGDTEMSFSINNNIVIEEHLRHSLTPPPPKLLSPPLLKESYPSPEWITEPYNNGLLPPAATDTVTAAYPSPEWVSDLLASSNGDGAVDTAHLQLLRTLVEEESVLQPLRHDSAAS